MRKHRDIETRFMEITEIAGSLASETCADGNKQSRQWESTCDSQDLGQNNEPTIRKEEVKLI